MLDDLSYALIQPHTLFERGLFLVQGILFGPLFGRDIL